MSRENDKAEAAQAEADQAQLDELEAEAAEKASETETPAPAEAEVTFDHAFPAGRPVAAHVPPTEVPDDVPLHPEEGTPLFHAGSPTGKAS